MLVADWGGYLMVFNGTYEHHLNSGEKASEKLLGSLT